MPVLVILAAILFIAAALAGLKLLVDAFSEGILWGLGYLFVPFVSLIFVATHWNKTRKTFTFSICCSVSAAACLLIAFGPEACGKVVAAALQKNPSFATHSNAPSEPVAIELVGKRQELSTLETWVRNEAAALTQTYNDLAKKRSALANQKQDAIVKFNAEAADYAQRKANFDSKSAEYTELRSEVEKLTAERSSIHATSPGQTSNVVMYSTSWCSACKAARDYLAQHNIPYEDHDVEHDSEAAEKFHSLGGNGVPLIIVNGKQMEGFDPEWIESSLHG